jgi:predicted acyl esterase
VPGTLATYETPPLAHDTDVVGSSQLHVRVDAPTYAVSQGLGPATQLVLFVKLLDVDPSGHAVLPANQLSAVRVADVTKPIDIDLPGIVHRFAAGHTVRLVITSSNLTNRGNTMVGPMSILTDPAAPSTLSMPVVSNAPSLTFPPATGAATSAPPSTTVAPARRSIPATGGDAHLVPLALGALLLGLGSRRLLRRT